MIYNPLTGSSELRPWGMDELHEGESIDLKIKKAKTKPCANSHRR